MSGITYEEMKQSLRFLEDTHLSIRRKNITNNDITTICMFLADNPQITYLDLTNKNITDESVIKLAENETVTYLHLDENNLSDKAAIALAKNTKLTVLYLNQNAITDDGARELGKNANLTHLYLSSNQITDKGAATLAENTVLKELDLSHNLIKDEEGTKALFARSSQMVFRLRPGEISDEDNNGYAEQKYSHAQPTWNISMMVLSGFTMAVGIAAVALAFTVLNAATGGVAGLVAFGVGVGVALVGLGLFAATAVNRAPSIPTIDDSSLNLSY